MNREPTYNQVAHAYICLIPRYQSMYTSTARPLHIYTIDDFTTRVPTFLPCSTFNK